MCASLLGATQSGNACLISTFSSKNVLIYKRARKYAQCLCSAASAVPYTLHVCMSVCACVSATVFYVARETRQPDFQLLCERRLFNEFIACWDSVTHTPRIRRRQASRQGHATTTLAILKPPRVDRLLLYVHANYSSLLMPLQIECCPSPSPTVPPLTRLLVPLADSLP